MRARDPSGSMVRTAVRTILRTGLSAMTIGTFAMASAQAAQTQTQNLEEVVVTGLRQSLESAIEIKREAEEIVDSVTAQDIGALPDRSVSEALQRIPGITLQRTNANRDPARLASEGGGVFIRGLSWVRSETNGRDIFSATNGRGISFEDISADLLSGIDVYKNPSAEQVEGGIGGIVNLRTRLPFDSKDQMIAISADYNYADLREDGFWSGNALFSDTWDVGGGRVGVLVSGSINNIGNRTDSIQTGRFESQTLSAADAARLGQTAGATVYVPNSIGWRRIDWEQKRTALSGAVQWAPNDAVTVTAQALHAEADPHDTEYAFGDTDGGYLGKLSRATFDGRGVLTSGTIGGTETAATDLDGTVPGFQPTADTRYGETHNRTSDYSLKVEFIPNDRWAFSGDVQYVTSKSDISSMTVFTQLSPEVVVTQPGNASHNVFGTLDFDLRGDTPRLGMNNARQGNKNAYWWAAAMDHLEDNEADSMAERLDAEYTFDDNPWLKSFRMGVRATDKEATTRQTGWNWGYLSQQFWCMGCGAPSYLSDGSANAGLPGASQLVNYGNFFRGDVNLPGIGWFPAPALVRGGAQNAYELLRSTQGAGWGWAPLDADDPYSDQTLNADNGNRGINNQTEETQAAYMVVRFEHGIVDGNIGVRAVRTKTETISEPGVQVKLGNPVNSDSVGNCTTGCQWFANAQAFVAAFVPTDSVTDRNSYTDVLPSLNLRVRLTDDLQLRFAAAKAIARPSFSQMQGSTLLTFDATGGQPTPGVVNNGIVGYSGNPDLNPTRSNQFDTSLEWYFAPGGSASIALFYKDIKDYIFAGQSLERYTAGNQSIDFSVTRNLNGDSGRVQGFEVAYQQFYDQLPSFLSGLGFQANFTYVDSSGGANNAVNVLDRNQTGGAKDTELPLEGLSKTSYNVALLYEKYDISARLAYNWREKYLLTTSAANINRPVWFDDFGQLDGSVFYSITPQVKVGVQATNLLNTRSFLEVGGATFSPRYSWTDTDRRIAFAVRSSF